MSGVDRYLERLVEQHDAAMDACELQHADTQPPPEVGFGDFVSMAQTLTAPIVSAEDREELTRRARALTTYARKVGLTRGHLDELLSLAGVDKRLSEACETEWDWLDHTEEDDDDDICF